MTHELAGKPVGSTGYGMMGLTWRPKTVSQSEAFQAMRAALATGANFFNGGEIYGTPERNSLHLLKEYFSKYPEDADKVVISIKGGFNAETHRPDGSEKNVRRSVDECLKVLDGKKKLDLFECARVDPSTPIEETVETLAQYIKDGKLGGISLSECSAKSIRRAAKIHKIEAVEVEFSLFATEILENGVAEACAELGITVVAYSPLGRGLLTGQVKTVEDLPETIRSFPRFLPENFPQNLKLVDEVRKVSEKKGCSVGQVAIAWVKGQSGKNGMPKIIPIPGATTESRVNENMKDVELTAEEMKELDRILKTCIPAGDRYPPMIAGLNFGDSPERT